MNIPPVSSLNLLDVTPDPSERAVSDRVTSEASQPDVLKAAQQLVQQSNTVPVSSDSASKQSKVIADPHFPNSGPLELTVTDVNGDGSGDAVIKDLNTGARAALLNSGNGAVDPVAVSLSAPNVGDLDRLSLSGKTTNRKFLAADLNGDGTRQFAVKSGNAYVSLGTSSDGTNITTSPVVDGLKEAEQRFQRLVAELGSIVPGLQLGQEGSSDKRGASSRTYVGFVQMNMGNVDPNPLRPFDLNTDNLGGFTMMDALGGTVSMFDPFGVGMRLYIEEDIPSPLSGVVGSDKDKTGGG
jgi:hypothetical protein